MLSILKSKYEYVLFIVFALKTVILPYTHDAVVMVCLTLALLASRVIAHLSTETKTSEAILTLIKSNEEQTARTRAEFEEYKHETESARKELKELALTNAMRTMSGRK